MLRASSPVSRLSWRKSTYSIANGECVEVAAVGGGVAVRDSSRQYDTRLQFPAADWRNFIAVVKKGAVLTAKILLTAAAVEMPKPGRVLHTSVR